MADFELKFFTRDDDILKSKCEDVDVIDGNVLSLLDRMLATMYDKGGIGLAANQVGLLKRLIVIDLQKDGIKSPIFLINPKILKFSKETIQLQEGCLSIPKQWAMVSRHATVEVEYRDRDGNVRNLLGEGLLSVCLQHEIDHLNGVLFTDHLSKLKRDLIKERVTTILRNKNNGY